MQVLPAKVGRGRLGRWGCFGLGILLLPVLITAAVGARQAEAPVAYVNLKYQLVRQGLDKDFVFRTFEDSRNQFLPDIVRKIAYLRKERPADYQHFLKPEVVARGRQYLQDHRLELLKAKTAYGVAPEVIVAILTVETNLGNFTGKYAIVNVFSSLAVMDSPEVMREVGLSSHLMPRLKKKAAWAQRELRLFLTYCRSQQLDPYQFKGSWAGAIGYSQFLPSSLVNCGRDGDGDGRVDLFTHPDAIASIACYLQKSGFNLANQKTWSRAVHAYNHSDAYVETVLLLAKWY